MSEPEGLFGVVATGDRRASLEALRDRLAREIDLVEGRDVAVLGKQLADVMRELANLPAAKGASSFDELRSRRAGRSAASAG